MSDHIKLLLAGAGNMAQEYAKVLQGMNIVPVVVGRGDKSALEFKQNTGLQVITGGIEKFLRKEKTKPDCAIVAVSVEALKDTAIALIEYGIKKILLEKPAGINRIEIEEVAAAAQKYGSEVYVAYNRRFYSSVIKLKESAAQDGGMTSFHFEFTEWSHTIEPLQKPKEVKGAWLLANSAHVIDLAFYLGGGKPEQFTAFSSGGLSWHPDGSIFTGAGKTKAGVLFSYHADWTAPGRWAVEMLTEKHRYYLKPLEKLDIQNIGSVKVEPVELDDGLDQKYKPGLFGMVQAFLEGKNAEWLCTLQEQIALAEICETILQGTDKQ